MRCISKRSLLCAFVAVVTCVVTLPKADATIAAPTLSAPADGSSFCQRSGTDFNVTGTADPSYSVGLVVNDAAGESTTPGTDGTFSFAEDKAPGTYSIAAQQDDGSGPVTSSPVNVSVFGADDSINRFARTQWATISPSHHDGYDDNTTLSVSAVKAGTIQFQVLKGITLVQSSPAISVSPGGTASWQWDGKGSSAYNGANYVSDGSYFVRALWTASNDESCTFSRVTVVGVDDTAPTIASYDETPDTFYPRTDDALTAYKDRVYFNWGKPSENTYVEVLIYPPNSSTPLGTLTKGWTSSAGSLSWSGHHSDGALWPAGTYTSRYRITDAQRNVHLSSARPFNLSWQHLVAKSATISLNGNAKSNETDGGCGFSDPGSSDWSTGLWLSASNCYADDYDIDGVLVDYSFLMPSAAYYQNLTFKADGYSMNGDQLFGFLHNFSTNADDIVGYVNASSESNRTFGTMSAANHVSSGRHVAGEAFLFSPCDCADVDYDVRSLSVTVTYGVLAS